MDEQGQMNEKSICFYCGWGDAPGYERCERHDVVYCTSPNCVRACEKCEDERTGFRAVKSTCEPAEVIYLGPDGPDRPVPEGLRGRRIIRSGRGPRRRPWPEA
jgi:hypothetical protein